MFTVKDFAKHRHAMVCEQLEKRGIVDQRVLEAMRWVPREQFVPKHLRGYAYGDSPLPIGAGQTISQPYTVAFMCATAELSPDDTVLEVGTGSGYGAAVLSKLCREVHTVDRIPELSARAKECLEETGCTNVHVHAGDGSLGLPAEAPFDAIIVTAGGKTMPQPYAEQLKDGGRVVMPLGATPRNQIMFRFRRSGDKIFSEELGSFAFVPLVGELGWPDGRR